MGKSTNENLEEVLGHLDANCFAAIKATGASLTQVIEAKAVVDGKSDIVGQGEQAISGPLKEVMTILQGAVE